MSRIFLKGGKAQIYHLFEVSGSQTGFPKCLKKNQKFWTEEGFTIFGIRRAWEGGVKIFMSPVVGWGYFLESSVKIFPLSPS